MSTRDNLQDVISEAQRRFVDDGMWKDLAVAEMAKMSNEVGDATRRAQAEFHQHGAVLQAADMGQGKARCDGGACSRSSGKLVRWSRIRSQNFVQRWR